MGVAGWQAEQGDLIEPSPRNQRAAQGKDGLIDVLRRAYTNETIIICDI